MTPRGLKLVKDMIPGYVDMQNDAVAGLTGPEQKQLSSLLGKLIRSVNDPVRRK